MIDASRLQYYTMSHRLKGIVDGISKSNPDDLIIPTLLKAAVLLEQAWDDYQSTLPPDQQIGS